MAWNDTPPTEDELKNTKTMWYDTPPTQEELDSTDTQLKALAGGVAQGATFGFAPQIGATLETGLETITGDIPQEQSLLERYRQLREENIAGMEKLREENPWTYGTGELVGGAAIPLGAGAKIGQKAFQAGKTALQAGKGMQAARTAAALRTGIESAKIGTVAGGLTGIAKSEGDVSKVIEDVGEGNLSAAAEELEKISSSAKTGAEIGAAGGMVLGGGGQLVGKAAGRGILSISRSLEDQVNTWRNLLSAARASYKGKPVVGEKAKEEISNQIEQKLVEPLAKDLQASLKMFGQKKGDILNLADDLKYNKNVTDDLNSMRDTIEQIPTRGDAVGQQEKDRLMGLIDTYQNALNKVKAPIGDNQEAAKMALTNIQNKLVKEGEVLGERQSLSPIQIDEKKNLVYFTDLKNGKVYSRPYMPEEPVSPLAQGKEILRTESGTGVMAKPELTPSEEMLSKEPGQFISKEKPKYESMMSPKELDTAAKQAYDLLQRSETAMGRKTAGEIYGKFKDLTRESLSDLAPAYYSANKGFSYTKDALQILAPKLDSFDNLDKMKAKDMLTEFFQGLASSTKGGDSARKRFENFVDKYKVVNPKLLDKLKPEIEELATRYDLNRDAARSGIQGILGTLEGLGVRTGAGIGNVAKTIKDAPKQLISAGKEYINSKSPEQLQSLAHSLSAQGQQFSKYVDTLQRAVNMDQRARNAAMFDLLQHSDFREAMDKIQENKSKEEMVKKE